MEAFLFLNQQKLSLYWKYWALQKSGSAGSHKQFRHPDGRCTTVPFHAGRDISPILLRQIAKDIGLNVEELLTSQRK